MVNDSHNLDWKLLEKNNESLIDSAPKWVINSLNKYIDSKSIRPYNKVKYFIGRTFIYKVFFKTISQGQIRPLIWRKLKT